MSINVYEVINNRIMELLEKPAHRHTHGEVLPFNMACGNVA